MTRRMTKTPPTSNPELEALLEKTRQATRICITCGCTEGQACTDPVLGSCWWVSNQLCSHSLPRFIHNILKASASKPMESFRVTPTLKTRVISVILADRHDLSRDYVTGFVDAMIYVIGMASED